MNNTETVALRIIVSSALLAVGDRVTIIAGVYKGRSGIVRTVGEYWHEVKPDQDGVGGLNPRGCMIIGAKSEWAKTANADLSDRCREKP